MASTGSRNISIKGSITGIGNVTGHDAQCNVQVKIAAAPLSRISISENTVYFEYNPSVYAEETRSFADHTDTPDDIELHRLIGQRPELERLAFLYGRAREQARGAIVFLTGPKEFGARALGRTFVDAVRAGGGYAAITRFWEKDLAERVQQDPRWSSLLNKQQEAFEGNHPYFNDEASSPLKALLSQLMDIPGLETRAAAFPEQPQWYVSYLKRLASPSQPLVLFLENFEYADPFWHQLLKDLAAEVNSDLPVLVVAYLDTEQSVDKIGDVARSSAEDLALMMSQSDIAETYHIARPATLEEIADYCPKADERVLNKLYVFTGGIPLLVEILWREWVSGDQLTETRGGRLVLRRNSFWFHCDSVRDYIMNMIQDQWEGDQERPWYADRMLDIFALAAEEGAVFTVDAAAGVFHINPDQLATTFLSFLHEPNNPGLVFQDRPVELVFEEARFNRKLRRYRFHPVIWNALKKYETQNVSNLQRKFYANQIEQLYCPFISRIAGTLERLYRQAGEIQKAFLYSQILRPQDPYQQLISEVEIIHSQPQTNVLESRLVSLIFELGNLEYERKSPVHAEVLYKELLQLASSRSFDFYIGFAQYKLGDVVHVQGQYEQARELIQQALEIFRQLEREDGAAACLIRLADIAHERGQYNQARELFQQALEINFRMSREDGTAACLARLGDVAQEQGQYKQARELFEQALEINRRSGKESGTADCLTGLGDVAHALGQYNQACELHEQALEIFRRLGKESRVAACLTGLGKVSLSQGQYRQSGSLFEQALEINRRLGRESGIADGLTGLGEAAQVQGQYALARELFEQVLKIERRLGRESMIATCLTRIAEAAHAQGQYEQARELFQQSLEIFHRLGRESRIAACLTGLGDVAHAQGQYAQARELFEQALEIFRRLGREDGTAVCLTGLGDIAHTMGQYGQARELFQQALEIERLLGRESGIAACLASLGEIAHVQGQYETARDLIQQAMEIFRQMRRESRIAACLTRLGDVSLAQGQYEQAAELFQQAVEIFRRLGRYDGTAVCLTGLGDIANAQGQHEQASELFEQALEIERRLGRASGIAGCLQSLGDVAHAQGQFELARERFELALEIFRRLGKENRIAACLKRLGGVADAQGRHEQAREFFQQAKRIIQPLTQYR